MLKIWVSGCGSVGRAVASDTRDLQFESSHCHILFIMRCIENKEKRGPFLKLLKHRSKQLYFNYTVENMVGVIVMVGKPDADVGAMVTLNETNIMNLRE